MATTFPEGLDSFLNPQPTDSVAAVSHAAQHADANDAIAALQAKLGVDNSSDTSSIDFRVTSLENQPFDSEAVMDAVDSVIVAGSGITKLYEDSSDTLTLSVDTSVIATQQFVTDAIDALNTDVIEEGLNNKYYSDTLARGAFTASGGINIDGNGVIRVDLSTGLEYENEPFDGPIRVDRDVVDTWYDAAGAAAAALIDANEYTDFAVASLGNNLPNIYVPLSSVGSIDGVASLGPDGKVPSSELNITETIQDVAAEMITGATHTNISVSYDDNTGKLSFTASGGGSSLTQEEVQDYVAPLFNHSSHTNITASYDDVNNKILLSSTASGAPLTQEEVQDFVAPLLNHAFHTNITATYDDTNNRIVLQGNSGSGGGASVIISPTPPSTPGLGDIWLDSDNGKTYIWDGAYWIEVGGSSSQAVAAVNSIPPSSPVLGSIWMNSSTAKTYIYDGSFWAQI